MDVDAVDEELGWGGSCFVFTKFGNSFFDLCCEGSVVGRGGSGGKAGA